jgi:hypothetical protein
MHEYGLVVTVQKEDKIDASMDIYIREKYCQSAGIYESGLAGIYESGLAGIYESGLAGIYESGLAAIVRSRSKPKSG